MRGGELGITILENKGLVKKGEHLLLPLLCRHFLLNFEVGLI